MPYLIPSDVAAWSAGDLDAGLAQIIQVATLPFDWRAPLIPVTKTANTLADQGQSLLHRFRCLVHENELSEWCDELHS